MKQKPGFLKKPGFFAKFINIDQIKTKTMLTKQEWEWLATGSEYQMVLTIQRLLEENQVMAASEGYLC